MKFLKDFYEFTTTTDFIGGIQELIQTWKDEEKKYKREEYLSKGF